ncbi:DnaJ domain-containing protein [Flammeovirgaceae bacterium SG7u.111]|nr:DnaJ domain-containing protein [Flammeovirgaceae bacterium SG7u.132]WPO38560.1 DnaJ domain-containing protein [Flammeovirgaceae bacterium SG7u.111]
MKNYYKVLGVSTNADEKAIKKAYKQLAVKFHPDKNPDNQHAHDKFAEINEAYQVLSDPNKRANYDFLTSVDVSALEHAFAATAETPQQKAQPKPKPPPPVFKQKVPYKPGKFIYAVIAGAVGIMLLIGSFVYFMGKIASEHNYEIAVAAYNAGNYSDANYYLGIALGHNDENSDALFLAGLMAEDHDEAFQKALTYYNEAISFAEKPVDVGFYKKRGFLCLKLERYDDAFSDFEKVLLQIPNDADALNSCGDILLYQKQQFEKAKGTYEKVLSVFPNDFKALLGKGIALQKTGEMQAAKELIEQSLEVNPQSPAAVYFLGVNSLEYEQDTSKTCQLWHLADSLGGIPGLKGEIGRVCN